MKIEGKHQVLLLALSLITYIFSLVSFIVIIFLIFGISVGSGCLVGILGCIFVYRFSRTWHGTSIKSTKSNGSGDKANKLSKKENPSEINDEDKIVFNHLFDRHNNILSQVDALDTKIAQSAALECIILSFIFFRVEEAASANVYFYGLFLIFISVAIGVLGYAPRVFYAGASTRFFSDCETFSEGEAVIKLKQQLILDIDRNEEGLIFKAKTLRYTLTFLIVGLFTIMVGYYA